MVTALNVKLTSSPAVKPQSVAPVPETQFILIPASAVTADPDPAPVPINIPSPAPVPAKASALVPAGEAALVPAEAPDLVPVKAPALVPAKATALVPAKAPALVPTKAPVPNPTAPPVRTKARASKAVMVNGQPRKDVNNHLPRKRQDTAAAFPEKISRGKNLPFLKDVVKIKNKRIIKCTAPGCPWLEENKNLKSHYQRAHPLIPFNRKTCGQVLENISEEELQKLRKIHADNKYKRHGASMPTFPSSS
jgi:hypothetical protein